MLRTAHAPPGAHLVPFDLSRVAMLDWARVARRRNHITAWVEADVTDARSALAAVRTAEGEALSFTGWVVACLSASAAAHPRVHALRAGKHHMAVFDAVDVGLVVERHVEGTPRGETLPMPTVVRAAQAKSVRAISAEIRAAQGRSLRAGEQVLEEGGPAPSPRAMRLFFRLPFVLRDRILWRRLFGNPARFKALMGTVAVTSVGMYAKPGRGRAGGEPRGLHPLMVSIGAIARAAAAEGPRVVEREMLGLTLCFDHDVVDGAPFARFVDDFRTRLESAWGLAPEALGPPAGKRPPAVILAGPALTTAAASFSAGSPR